MSDHKTNRILIAAGALLVSAVILAALLLVRKDSETGKAAEPNNLETKISEKTLDREPAPELSKLLETEKPTAARTDALEKDPDPKAAAILSLRKEAAAKAGTQDFSGAIETLDRALRLDPENRILKRELSKAYALKGWSSFQKKDYMRAKGCFEEALYYWPGNALAIRGLGFAYFQEKDRDQAERWLKAYTEIGGDRPDAYLLLGRICYESDRPEEALYYFETSIALAPEQPEVVELANKIRREMRVEADFEESESRHFRIKYEGAEDPAVAKIVRVVCEEAYLLVGRRLGVYPEEVMTVILYTDQQFQDVTRSPAWAGAIFDGKIRIPAKGLYERTDELERLIFHEYTHAAVHYASRGSAPIWLHEGLAQSSEELQPDPPTLAQKIREAGGPMPLAELEAGFLTMPRNKAMVAYMESWLAVHYLYEEYGPFSIREILRFLSQGEKIDAAILKYTSKDYAAFDAQFRAWLMAMYQ